MKQYRGPDGSERVWFDPHEIESIMEDELCKAGLIPSLEHPAVDLETFIEQHLKADLDQYAPLDPAILGITEFRRGSCPKISINRDLTGAANDMDDIALGAPGRWRATLGHEAAHVLLHRALFELSPEQGSLWEVAQADGSGQRVMRCLKREVSFRPVRADWREVQANRGMAALIMPRRLFSAAARQELNSSGSSSDSVLQESPHHAVVVGRLSARFRVSRQAASIRLQTVGVVAPAGAMGFRL